MNTKAKYNGYYRKANFLLSLIISLCIILTACTSMVNRMDNSSSSGPLFANDLQGNNSPGQNDNSQVKTDSQSGNENQNSANGQTSESGQKNSMIELSAGEMDAEMAHEFAARLVSDMAESWLKLKRVDMSDYFVDNLDTHLTLLWIDFDIADRTKNTWRKLKSIDNIEVTDRKYEIISEKKVAYEGFADIDYTRFEPSVNGIGVDLELVLENYEGKWMITGAVTSGASVYRSWKEAGYETIEAMDKAFLDTCRKNNLSTREWEKEHTEKYAGNKELYSKSGAAVPVAVASVTSASVTAVPATAAPVMVEPETATPVTSVPVIKDILFSTLDGSIIKEKDNWIELKEKVKVQVFLKGACTSVELYFAPTGTETYKLQQLIDIAYPENGAAEYVWEVPEGVLAHFWVVAYNNDIGRKSDLINIIRQD